MRLYIFGLLLAFSLTGCATTYTKFGQHYETKKTSIKSIAVLPIDFKIYSISAGGVTEEMDEWSQKAIEDIKNAMQVYMAPSGVRLHFLSKDDLISNKDIWFAQQGLFEALSTSIYAFAYVGSFKERIDHFDYTMGPEFRDFAKTLDADAVCFIQGADSERTTGRFVMEMLQAGIVGIHYYYTSIFRIGLIDSETGEVLWFKVNNGQDIDFRKPKNVDNLIKWFSQDFLTSI